MRSIEIIKRECELIAHAQVAVHVRQELRRVPRVRHERRRLDVAVLLIQFAHDARIDKQQVSDELNVAAGHGRVAVQDFDAIHAQFRYAN